MGKAKKQAAGVVAEVVGGASDEQLTTWAATATALHAVGGVAGIGRVVEPTTGRDVTSAFLVAVVREVRRRGLEWRVAAEVEATMRAGDEQMRAVLDAVKLALFSPTEMQA